MFTSGCLDIFGHNDSVPPVYCPFMVVNEQKVDQSGRVIYLQFHPDNERKN